MLKNLALAAWSLSLLLIVACSDDFAGGGTIDPNANRGDINAFDSESSSSSVGSSSETNNGLDVIVSVSSSAEGPVRSSASKENSSSSNDRGSNNLVPDIPPKGDTIVHYDTIVNPSVPGLARNFSAQCIIDYVKVDSAELVPVTDEPVAAADVLGASAYKSVDGDSVNIYLDGAYLNTPCDSAEEVQFFEEINSGNKIPVGLVNDTLSMTLRWDKTCACAATVSFTLDKPSKDFNYIIFDLWMPILFEER